MLTRPHSSLVHAAKYVLSAEHRELTRIGRIPRYTGFTTTLLGIPTRAVDGPSFVFSYGEIFKREIYRFTADHKAPFIIDCGANIGLSVIYFKRLYPESRIIAFEADSGVFQVLSQNMRSFALNDITLHNVAVWK